MNPIPKKPLNYTRVHNLMNLKDLSERVSDVEYFVFFGTLLGYCRDGNLIENDDDIDFYVNIRERNKIINILQDIGFCINIHNEYFIQALRLIDDNETFSDFYFYEDDLDRDYLVERWNFLAQPYNVSRHLHVPKKIVFPLKQGRINDINFNIPYDIDACCRYLYGENYKTPLNKETQYDVKIVNNKPVIIKKYNGIVTVPKIPIFIIVKDKQEALKMAIKSFYANIKTPFEIVIYNNNSSCTKTIKFLRDLEKSGTKIYWNQASDAKSVDVRVKEWMSENYSSDNYFITDTDASFIKSGVS